MTVLGLILYILITKDLDTFWQVEPWCFLLKHMNMNYSYFFYYSPYLKINVLIVKFLLNSNHNFRNSRVLPFEAHGGDSTIINMASWGRIHQTIFTVSILYFGTADFVELTGIQNKNRSFGLKLRRI